MAGSMIVVDTNAGESALYEALVRRFDGSTVQRHLMLAQVPGMSAHKAAVVAAAYPTMSALSAAPQEQLANVLVPPASPSRTASSGGGGGGGAAKKPRRLGPKVAERLAQL